MNPLYLGSICHEYAIMLPVILSTAFLQGLVGSTHCIGMCGPFVALLSTRENSGIVSNLAYNMGRTISYSVIGFILGMLGWGANRFFFAEVAGWIGGGIVIILGLSYIFPILPGIFQWRAPKIITNFTASWLKNIQNTNLLSFLMGSISGLLPCGLLFPAYGLALLTGDAMQGALVMSVFSLGTYPMLLGIGFAGNHFIRFLQNARYRIILGILLVILGIFTLWNRSNSSSIEEDCHTPPSNASEQN